jgi:ring-1,2-phenylacetyl-CoA epoxidase subunit PaaB
LRKFSSGSQHGLALTNTIQRPDASMMVNHARDVYTRRNEGVSDLGSAVDIVARVLAIATPLFELSNSRYRHPTFFLMLWKKLRTRDGSCL